MIERIKNNILNREEYTSINNEVTWMTLNTNNNNDNIDRTIKKLSKSIVWFKLIISIVRNKHNEYSSVMITGN